MARYIEAFDQLNRAGWFRRGPATNRPSWKMLTLTLAPREDLAAAIREIAEHWRRLKLLVGFEKDQKDRLFGAIAAIEVGPHRNVHLHVTYWGRYVPKELLSERWHQLTGDSYVVHIKQLHGSWREAVRETCKYVTKLAETDAYGRSPDAEPCAPELFLVDVLEAYRGRRRIMTYGLFYNVKVPDAEPATCQHCGEPLTYVGTFAPEHLHTHEVLAFYQSPAPPGAERAA